MLIFRVITGTSDQEKGSDEYTPRIASHFTIRAGSKYQDKGGQIFEVAEVHVHPGLLTISSSILVQIIPTHFNLNSQIILLLLLTMIWEFSSSHRK